MKFEVEMEVEDLTGAVSNMAKREARKIVREKLIDCVQKELRDGACRALVSDYIQKEVAREIDNHIHWRIHSLDEVEFKGLSEREKDWFARGMALAHSFDMDNLLGSDEIVDRLIEGAKDELYLWAKQNPTLQNKFIRALRENDKEV